MQERKVVTVLFCDLVGSTAQAEEMDPEDVAALLAPFHARVKEELERFGGTVEKFIGDAVMGLFGAPVAHEDDPERAVRAALSIRQFAEDEGLELRIGITTGEALVTLDARPDAGETMAAGDVVNTAARLQSAAPVNGILVGAKTHEATKAAIEYSEPDAVEAKGKSQPVAVWEARRARSRIGLDRPHSSTLVGRDGELDVLVAALTRAREERQPQLVTLVGVPGIGKSRLVYELSQQVDRDPELVAWRQGRCLPYGDGVTFWALAEIVKAQLGLTDGDSVAETEAKLDTAVGDEWLRGLLRPLAGLASEELGQSDRSEETFAAWRRFVESIADDRPLVLVFEDLHWADERLLDFVDYLVDWATGVPLLVVCTARPELLERRAGWGGGKTNAATISLSPLSDEETARLVGELLDRPVMSADAQAAVLARAGGNPLYAEQYARVLAERDDDDLPLPENVQGLIAARLDGLEPDQKALLQDASVVGKTFWLDALAAIADTDERAIEASLHALERKGFVRRERDASIEGSTEYAFLHLLVRDVAYGQIPRAPRAQKHLAAAHWIECYERGDEYAEMLAHHYGEALALTRAAGGEVGALEEPGRRALRSAGDRASALHAYVAAQRYYAQALDLWPPDDADRPQLLLDRAKAVFFGGGDPPVELFAEAASGLLELGDREGAAEAESYRAFALWNSGTADRFDVLDVSRSAALLVADAPMSRVKAFVVAQLARYLSLVGEYEEAVPVVREALSMADQLGLAAIRGHALNTLGIARVSMGDPDGLDDLEEGLRLSVEHGSPHEISRSANNLSALSYVAGRTARAAEVAVARVELERTHGLPTWFGETMLASLDHDLGEWERALQRFDAVIGGGFPSASWPGPRAARADMRLARGDDAGFEADFAVALEAIRDDIDPADLGTAVACAWLALEVGRRREAEELVDVILAIWRRPYGGAAVVDMALLLEDLARPSDPIADAVAACPRLPWVQVAASVVRGDLASAASQVQTLRCPPYESTIRLRLGLRLLAEGRAAEAEEQLRLALEFWRRVGATRYARKVEELLEMSSRSAQSNA